MDIAAMHAVALGSSRARSIGGLSRTHQALGVAGRNVLADRNRTRPEAIVTAERTAPARRPCNSESAVHWTANRPARRLSLGALGERYPYAVPPAGIFGEATKYAGAARGGGEGAAGRVW